MGLSGIILALPASGIIDPSCSGPKKKLSLTLSYLSRGFGIKELMADRAGIGGINFRDLLPALGQCNAYVAMLYLYDESE